MEVSMSVDLAEDHQAASRKHGTIGKAHGTFGELLQGSLPGEDGHFLVTLPINRFSYATFYRDDDAGNVRVKPAHKTKSRDMAKDLLHILAPQLGGELVLRGDLVEGKGLASSSADLVACARAIAAALGKPLDIDMLLGCMGRLEPSDGVMFDSCNLFYHRRVKAGHELGPPPSVRILALDEGGTVDTVQYNSRLKPYTNEEKCQYSFLLMQLDTAFHEENLTLLGSVCTRGALMNQSRNPKKQFDQVNQIAQTNDALGVVVSHSGTMLGIMLSHYDHQFEAKEAQIKAQLAQLEGQLLEVDSLSYKKQGEKPW